MSLEFDNRLRAVESAALLNRERIDGHERVCAERYQAIADKTDTMMQRIGATTESIDKTNSTLLKVGIGLLGGLATIIVKLMVFP